MSKIWSVDEILPMMCAFRAMPEALPVYLRFLLRDWVKAVDAVFMILGREPDYVWTADELRPIFTSLFSANSSRVWGQAIVAFGYALMGEFDSLAPPEVGLDLEVWDEGIPRAEP